MKYLLVVALVVFNMGCAKKANPGVPSTPESPQQIARDAIAASRGAIQTAQAKYQSTCNASPQQTPCDVINRAIYAQQAAIASLYTYCQFSLASDSTAVCKPVDSALTGLMSAVTNLNQVVTSIKGVLQ